MKIELTVRQQQRKDRFRLFADTHIAPVAGDFDRQEAITDEVVELVARNGLLGSHLPTEHGGRGFDMISYGLLHEALGRACSSTRSLLTVHDMVCEAILRLGNAQLRQAWLPVLASGKKIGAFALTEPEVGSDAGSLQTTATQDGDDYVLNGRKKWISFAQLADVFLVVARVGRGGPIGGFLVPADAPGLTVTPITGMLGLRASMLGELDLTACPVPSSARVGPAKMPSGLVVATALQLGRYSVAWGCVGIGEACLEASFRYSETREQFGVPISKHQLIRRMLTNMLTDVRAARLLCYEAGYLAQDRKPGTVEATLIAKYFSSRMATRVAGDAVQLHGASGGSAEQPVERYFRDARLMEIIEGSTEIQQITIPKYGRQAYAD
ncbi:MAG TPA: acyl-CoA dehydrogenase family protein [Acidimicrobiia bacterium]|nr:acyl-CoA dehydrogenase family protein [Acidimicrobiia bacterium]